MEGIKIDSALSLGGYNWRVLDIQNNTALIVIRQFILVGFIQIKAS